MVLAATEEGCTLFLVSGFRSRARQAEIIRAKLGRGMPMEEILRVSAYPGFSEHHTGLAVDVAAPACPELVEAFEATPEFQWLKISAARFGFALSYPRGNTRDIAYEPWHWCLRPVTPS